MQVIPVINVPDLATAKDRLEKAAEFSDLIHLDITDGVFTNHRSWGSPSELSKLVNSPTRELDNIFFEVHLMVNNPEEIIEDWLKINLVKRVVVHVEAVTDYLFILEKCRQYGAEAVLAANPDTDIDKLLTHQNDFKYFQLLAVAPGPAGQKLELDIVDKLRLLRSKLVDGIIEIDGGVNLETAKLLKEAGADILASGTYIFGSHDPKRVYEDLIKI